MLIMTNTQELDSACDFGEALRAYCFKPDKYGGSYGCYSTFELHPEFKKIRKNSKVGEYLIGLLFLDCWKKELYDSIQLFTNDNVYLAWVWDGDGTLLIMEGEKKAINTDCKCDYTWEWIEDDKGGD